MATAIDCKEHEGNGGGCVPLRIVASEVDRIRNRQGEQDAREGRFLAAVGESRDAAHRAETAAHKALVAVERVECKIFEPVNDTIAKWSSPPLDYGDDVGEITRTQDTRALIQRAKHAERTRIYVAVIGAVTALATAATAYFAARGH